MNVSLQALPTTLRVEPLIFRFLTYSRISFSPLNPHVRIFAAEIAIRPFVIGRKNWLFNSTAEGARASAALYSLIETAKANKLEPCWYLRHLFENLPATMTQEEFRQLLPMNFDASLLDISEYK